MMEAPAAERRIASLHQALLLLDEHPEHIAVKVDSVQARHAPALLHLLRNGELNYGWDLRSVIRTEQLSKLMISVDTVEVAVLPLLQNDGMDLTAGRLLRRCAWDIRNLGRKIDGRNGDFNHAAYGVSAVLINANRQLANHQEPIGADKIDAVREAMEGLKPLLVLLSDDELNTGDGDRGCKADGAPPAEKTLHNLKEALLLYDQYPPPLDVVISVASVYTGHAPPLLHLLLKGVENYGWDVSSFGTINRLAKVAVCLDTIHLAVLPMLQGNDTIHLVAAGLLRRYGRQIGRHGKKIDRKRGVFSQATHAFSTKLIDAYKLVNNGQPIGQDHIAGIHAAMEGLKMLLVLLPN